MDVEDDDWFERERLHFAAQEGDLDEVQTLVSKGVDVNAFDDLGMTPLHYAAKGEHVEVAHFLLEHGANVNAHDEPSIGNTPLGEIASNCSHEMAKVLVDAGADPTIPGWMGITALHAAAERKQQEGQKVHQLLLNASKRRSR